MRRAFVFLHWRMAEAALAFGCCVLPAACSVVPPPSEPDDLVSRGERIFLTETFDGNGRTCSTCHRPTDNFTLSPSFIARLPADDPLFVAERNSDLGRNFENPRLMREFGLILENQDGFDDLENNFNMRGIPHTLALAKSVAGSDRPRTGWSGDGAPGDGSLRAFATGAVIQHFTRTTNRVVDEDFRLPTELELDALEAFQLSLGRQEDLALPLRLRSVVPVRGQEIFMDNTLGKCNACHFNAGANADPDIFGTTNDNRNFDTGVENSPDQPADLTGERMPEDDGFGIPGNGEFNTPPLVEAADTGPFFHNNSIETIEGVVAFYNGQAFNNSPAGQLLNAATGGGIDLDATQVVAVAAFLRVINVLENIRSSNDLIDRAFEGQIGMERSAELLERAISETEDAVQVLQGGGLHAAAGLLLDDAHRPLERALESRGRSSRTTLGRRAIEVQELARAEMVES